MITKEDEKFLAYWQANREKEKSFWRQFSMVLPIAFLLGIGIVLNLVTGWYKRATMIANSQSTPIVLILALIIISVFCSVFYKRHRWEMHEQRYLELQAKTNKSSAEMQHDETKNSLGTNG